MRVLRGDRDAVDVGHDELLEVIYLRERKR